MRLLLVLLGSAHAATDARTNLAVACPQLAAQCTTGFAPPDFACMLKTDVSQLSPGVCQDALKSYLAVEHAQTERVRGGRTDERQKSSVKPKSFRNMQKSPQNSTHSEHRSLWQHETSRWGQHARTGNVTQNRPGKGHHDDATRRQAYWRLGRLYDPKIQQRSTDSPRHASPMNTTRKAPHSWWRSRNATRRQADWKVGANVSSIAAKLKAHFKSKDADREDKREHNYHFKHDESTLNVESTKHSDRSKKSSSDSPRNYWELKIKSHKDKSKNGAKSSDNDDDDDDREHKSSHAKRTGDDKHKDNKKKMFKKAVKKVVKRMQFQARNSTHKLEKNTLAQENPVSNVATLPSPRPVQENPVSNVVTTAQRPVQENSVSNVATTLPSPRPVSFARPISFAPIETVPPEVDALPVASDDAV